MATCNLCGNEEIEKPRTITKNLFYGGFNNHVATVSMDFGSYCFSKKRSACKAKVDEIIQSHINLDLDKNTKNGLMYRNRKLYRW